MAENRLSKFKSDLLHPLATLHWESCHSWGHEIYQSVNDVQPTHCAVLHNTIVMLSDETTNIHVSNDLQSWSHSRAPHMYSSLTTYQSKFVLVGGYIHSKYKPSKELWTSTDGLNWTPYLLDMPTRRSHVSSVSGGSPEVLVVAGGQDRYGNMTNIVEVLLGDRWSTVDSLPTPCIKMQSTLHEGNFYFTGGENKMEVLYTCSCDTLIASARKRKTTRPAWKEMTIPHNIITIASCLSRLILIDEDYIIRGYSTTTQALLEPTTVGHMLDKPQRLTCNTCMTGFSTSQIVIVNVDKVYRGTLSESTFDSHANFIPDVLPRLEAAMDIQIVTVLDDYLAQLQLQTITSGVERISILHIKEVILQKSTAYSYYPPVWCHLLYALRCIGLEELSEQIEAFMRADYRFEDAYKHFIDSKDVLELLSLKFMFLGPPRLGKSTTRRRVMKEIVDLNTAEEAEQVHGSTGAVECCPNMLVQDLSDPATEGSGTHWTIAQNLTDEACLLFHSIKDGRKTHSIPEATQHSHDGIETIAEESPSTSTEQPRPVVRPPQPKLLQKMMTKIKKSVAKMVQSTPKAGPADSTVVSTSDYSEVAAIYKEVSQIPEFLRNEKNSFKAYLRMEDTGGQPELMDMLPALTIGPGLYLLFFSYEFKLDEQYQVFYQRDSGETTAPEKSEFTLKEMLLCTLASISCSSASTHCQQLPDSGCSEISEIHKSSKSVVYLVGTHKDKVSEDYISAFDQQLQEIIIDTDFYREGTVQFCSEDKLAVSLDNMGGGIEEITQLHQLLEGAMEKHFKKLKIPAVWLLFSLCLRMRNVGTASIETCLALAGAFNMTPKETKVALWFLHHHAGVMMYFPNVSGLEDLVIIDIQVVYDSITGVILNAMSFDSVGKATAERFRKTGQFSVKDLVVATTKTTDLIPPLKLVALLEYLHIVARIISIASSSHTAEKRDDIYIMPCILCSASKEALDAVSRSTCRPLSIAPLRVHYACGFVPIGVFSAMTASYIGNHSFKLKEVGIMKNLVQFHFGSNLALVTFLGRPTYYEIIITDLGGNHEPHLLCQALKKEIDATFMKVNSRMNYPHFIDYQFGFECPIHPNEDHVMVVDKESLSPQAMLCLKDQVSKNLQSWHKVWYGEPLKYLGKSSHSLKNIPSGHIDRNLTCGAVMQLFHCEVPFSKAKDLGVFLEIKPVILEDLIFIQKDVQGMMTAVINHWLEHGSNRSWSKLAEAVEYCGYKVMAEEIRKKYA